MVENCRAMMERQSKQMVRLVDDLLDVRARKKLSVTNEGGEGMIRE